MPDLCMHRLFEAHAERTPDATAVIFREERLTYAALNIRVNQLAHHLRTRGVGPETPVGVCLERSATMIVALLAVLKAGGGLARRFSSRSLSDSPSKVTAVASWSPEGPPRWSQLVAGIGYQLN